MFQILISTSKNCFIYQNVNLTTKISSGKGKNYNVQIWKMIKSRLHLVEQFVPEELLLFNIWQTGLKNGLIDNKRILNDFRQRLNHK
jgi:hypothetical protein